MYTHFVTVAWLTYNNDDGYFRFVTTPSIYPHDSQLTYPMRNTATGALYLVWWDKNASMFALATTISGSTPTTGQGGVVQYFNL